METKPLIPLYNILLYERALLKAEYILLSCITPEGVCNCINEETLCHNSVVNIVVKEENDHYNIYAILRNNGTAYIRRVVRFEKDLSFSLYNMAQAHSPLNYFNCYALIRDIETNEIIKTLTLSRDEYNAVKDGYLLPDESTNCALAHHCYNIGRLIMGKIKVKLSSPGSKIMVGAESLMKSTIYDECALCILDHYTYETETPYSKMITIENKKFNKETIK